MTTSAPDSAPVDKATVLAWMRDTGRGYKAASREFGIPRSTIQSWAIADRAPPSEPRPRPQARAREAKPAPAPIEEEPWDPNTCTREQWLRRGMVRALELSKSEHKEGHSGNAVRWETLAIRYRDELDELLEEQKLAGLVPAPVDLVSLAREIAELLPALVRMDVGFWVPVALLLVTEIAKYRGGLWSEFAERLKEGR